MHRDAMIDLLVHDCLESAVSGRRGVWLLSILRDGFAGFARMSDAQLSDEFMRRGLMACEKTVDGHDDWQGADGIDDWLIPRAATRGGSEGHDY